jgi:hypothetical protein
MRYWFTSIGERLMFEHILRPGHRFDQGRELDPRDIQIGMPFPHIDHRLWPPPV